MHTCIVCSISNEQFTGLYRAIVQRRVLQCGYAESKRNVYCLLSIEKCLVFLYDASAFTECMGMEVTQWGLGAAGAPVRAWGQKTPEADDMF